MEPTAPQIPFHPEADDSIEAMVQRVQELYGIERTALDELRDLAGNPAESERFDVFLDDLTYGALAENEEFNDNRMRMATGKLPQDKQLELRNKQRELFSRYRQGIIEEAGLPTETALTDAEKSKKKIQTILSEVADQHEATQPVKALEALGIITHDKDGKEIFTYPTGLFPSSTDNKWDVYLASVREHLGVKRDVAHGIVDRTKLGEADTMRRMAHNAVARDVDDILGLDKLNNSKWNFEKTRNLLAKMRDSRFPTVETAEKFVTEDAVLEGVIGLHALKTLHTKLSDMHDKHAN
ncbi:MAG: hypothetical protein JWN82_486 [Candidatus Saccharibacteria bacterium]|nr:hypothetical protein [Candidatus Saccharibacteria bacterium]